MPRLKSAIKRVRTSERNRKHNLHYKSAIKSVLKKIADRVDSSVQAVTLEWCNQKGVTPIPHSTNSTHIVLNAMVPGWDLTDEDIREIDQIKHDKSSTCNWQQYLISDLLAKSNTWLAELRASNMLLEELSRF